MMARRLTSHARLFALACGAFAIGGCSEPGSSVELSVISGIANQPDEGWTLELTTPNGELSGPLGTGDQTDSENWATFEASLDEGDPVGIEVRNAAGTLVLSGTCTVTNAASLGYAWIFVYLHTTPRTVSCQEGFLQSF